MGVLRPDQVKKTRGYRTYGLEIEKFDDEGILIRRYRALKKGQPENDRDYRDSITLSTPYNVSSRSSLSSIPEPGPVASGSTNGMKMGDLFTHHALAFRARVARSTPCFLSVAHRSTRWKAKAVTLRPIVPFYKFWQSVRRTWFARISTLPIRSLFKDRTLLPYRTAQTGSKSVQSKRRCTISVGPD